MVSLRSRAKYLYLIGIFFVYSCTEIFTKKASLCEFFSIQYLLNLGGAVAVLGLYALLWQQIIKRMPLSDAYMFKGTSVIWILLICFFFFDEPITLLNVLGSVLIIAGITIYVQP